MKKKYFPFLFIIILFTELLQAQNLNYHVIIRCNDAVVNSEVTLTVEILERSTTGTVVYSEEHTLIPLNGNAFIEIGTGTNTTGSLSDIRWGTADYYVKIIGTVTDDGSAIQALVMPITTNPVAEISKQTKFFVAVTDNDTTSITPQAGDMFFNTDKKLLKLYTSGVWKDLTLGGYVEVDTLWSYFMPGGNSYVKAGVTLADDGTVFVGIDGGGTVDNIFAIDKNGNKKWSYKSGAGKIYGSMSLSESNDTLFGADGGGYVFALNTADGNEMWSNKVSTRTYYTGTTLSSDGKTLYCGFYTGNNDIKALNTSDGSIKWEYDITNGVTGTPVIGADGTIYFADLYRRMYALKDNGTAAEEVWKVEDQMSKTCNPFPIDGSRDVLYIGTQANHFYAVNLTDGSIKWENTEVNGVYLNGASIAPNGIVYITSETDSMLRAMNPDTGETLWTYKLKDKVKAVPSIDSDGNIYIGDLSGYFYVITKDGEELWKPVKLSGEIWSSCAISNDGNIYVVAYDPDNGGDRLYALKAGGKPMETEGWPTRGLNNKRQNSAYVDAIKVMSFNIYHGGATMDDDYNMDTIASVIKREDPVLVALQEVDNGTDRANGLDVAKELGDRCGMYYLFGRAIDYQNGEYGVAILSKYPIIDNKLISLPTSDDEEDRVALMVKISINGKNLWFISTHFSYTDSQVQQAETVTNEAFSLDAPAILGGDLNAEPGSEAINYMEQYWNKTYNNENIRNTFSSTNPTKKIDYIMFTSDDWSVIFDRVVIDKEASDHYAYVSYIKF